MSVPGEDDVTEDDRHGAGLAVEVCTLLDVEVQMWPQRVAGVSDRSDLLTALHVLAVADLRASLLEVRQDGVAVVADLENDVVAKWRCHPGFADGFVGVDVAHADYEAICRGEHGLVEAVPGLQPLRVTDVAATVDDLHEVKGVPDEGCLVGVVVAEQNAAATRDRLPFSGQW